MRRLNINVISFAPKRLIFTAKKCPNVLTPNLHVFTASAPAKKRGVLTAIRDTVAFTMHSEVADSQGCYHILICDINSTTYTVVNVYAPNTRQVRFLHQVLKKQTGAKGLSFDLWRF